MPQKKLILVSCKQEGKRFFLHFLVVLLFVISASYARWEREGPTIKHSLLKRWHTQESRAPAPKFIADYVSSEQRTKSLFCLHCWIHFEKCNLHKWWCDAGKIGAVFLEVVVGELKKIADFFKWPKSQRKNWSLRGALMVGEVKMCRQKWLNFLVTVQFSITFWIQTTLIDKLYPL